MDSVFNHVGAVALMAKMSMGLIQEDRDDDKHDMEKYNYDPQKVMRWHENQIEQVTDAVNCSTEDIISVYMAIANTCFGWLELKYNPLGLVSHTLEDTKYEKELCLKEKMMKTVCQKQDQNLEKSWMITKQDRHLKKSDKNSLKMTCDEDLQENMETKNMVMSDDEINTEPFEWPDHALPLDTNFDPTLEA